MEDWNELDAIYDLVTMYKNRKDNEENEEKKLMLTEIIESLEEVLVLADNYLMTN